MILMKHLVLYPVDDVVTRTERSENVETKAGIIRNQARRLIKISEKSRKG